MDEDKNKDISGDHYKEVYDWKSGISENNYWLTINLTCTGN